MQKRYASKSSNRRRSHLRGIVAEYLCAGFLILKGYSILKMRYRNYSGEIDIIAVKKKMIIFIEVKARQDKDAALYSVTPAKQEIVSRAASIFIASHTKYTSHSLRFDVMVVTSLAKIYHLKDAWRV